MTMSKTPNNCSLPLRHPRWKSGAPASVVLANPGTSPTNADRDTLPRDLFTRKLTVPNAERILFIRHAIRAGFRVEETINLTRIDRRFLVQINKGVDLEDELASAP